MGTTASLTSRFRLYIPKDVREAQQWKAGQELVFVPKGNGVLVMPAPDLHQLAGIAKGARTDGYRDRTDQDS